MLFLPITMRSNVIVWALFQGKVRVTTLKSKFPVDPIWSLSSVNMWILDDPHIRTRNKFSHILNQFSITIPVFESTCSWKLAQEYIRRAFGYAAKTNCHLSKMNRQINYNTIPPIFLCLLISETKHSGLYLPPSTFPSLSLSFSFSVSLSLSLRNAIREKGSAAQMEGKLFGWDKDTSCC